MGDRLRDLGLLRVVIGTCASSSSTVLFSCGPEAPLCGKLFAIDRPRQDGIDKTLSGRGARSELEGGFVKWGSAPVSFWVFISGFDFCCDYTVPSSLLKPVVAVSGIAKQTHKAKAEMVSTFPRLGYRRRMDCMAILSRASTTINRTTATDQAVTISTVAHRHRTYGAAPDTGVCQVWIGGSTYSERVRACMHAGACVNNDCFRAHCCVRRVLGLLSEPPFDMDICATRSGRARVSRLAEGARRGAGSCWGAKTRFTCGPRARGT